MKLSTNFQDYLKGKAKLQHAVHIDPNDKIQNFIKSSTNHRFWANDYEKFKKGLTQDVPPAPVPFDGELKLRKKKDSLLESLRREGVKYLEDTVLDTTISLNDVPKEMDMEDESNYVDMVKAVVKYTAELDSNRSFVENIHFNINEIDLEITIHEYDEKIDDSKYHYYQVTMKDPMDDNTNIIINQPPYNITDLTISCFNTTDVSKWKITEVTFGNRSRY